jgi:hypothetical protein
VTHFYPSEFGGDIEREPLINEWYSRDKLLTRARFRAKSKEVSSFKYTYLCAESLLRSCRSSWLWTRQRDFFYFSFYGDPENVWSYFNDA